MPHLWHENCNIYGLCPACRRNNDAFEMAAGTFGCLVVLTVCPVTVLFVIGARAVAGNAGMWSAVTFLICLPALVGAWTWRWADRGGR